ncbi:hypothetical protein [uncultured Anaerovibrio sp.]|uniref:hypothetical protein n=1 Tax=uncultured Anaerovibrio sp. TaxID=361586 RepID=UPI0025DCAA6C|nr:hypothetical protein [uncultured Anaerovibrio sp.]
MQYCAAVKLQHATFVLLVLYFGRAAALDDLGATGIETKNDSLAAVLNTLLTAIHGSN